MTFQHKEGKATLFHNDRKGNDRAPSYTGTGMYKGEEIRISCWVNKTEEGETRLGLNIEEKQKPTQQRQESPALSTDFGEPSNQLDDEIPW